MIVFASAKTQSMDATQITNLGVAMAEAVNKFYPPAILFTNALLHNDLAGFVIFATVSLLLGIAFITIVSHYYKRLNTAVFSHYAKKEYKMGTLTSTTAASLSLEGKNRWIMCSAPTQARTVYNSKIAVNLTVILPVLYISAIFIRIAITCSLMQTVLLFIIPTVYAFFISVLGVYLNIKFPKYDWTSEYYAVKGGAISVLATVGGGMASSLTPLYLCIIFPHYQMMIMFGITCLILLATLAIYLKVCRTQLYV